MTLGSYVGLCAYSDEIVHMYMCRVDGCGEQHLDVLYSLVAVLPSGKRTSSLYIFNKQPSNTCFDDIVFSSNFIIKSPRYDMFNFYPHTKSREEFENRLIKEFPFIKKETIGKSLVNRNIEAFTIGNKNKKIIMVGGVHGSEYLTINLLYKFLWQLGCSYRDGSEVAGIKMKRYLHRRGGWSFATIPCVVWYRDS